MISVQQVCASVHACMIREQESCGSRCVNTFMYGKTSCRCAALCAIVTPCQPYMHMKRRRRSCAHSSSALRTRLKLTTLIATTPSAPSVPSECLIATPPSAPSVPLECLITSPLSAPCAPSECVAQSPSFLARLPNVGLKSKDQQLRRRLCQRLHRERAEMPNRPCPSTRSSLTLSPSTFWVTNESDDSCHQDDP